MFKSLTGRGGLNFWNISWTNTIWANCLWIGSKGKTAVTSLPSQLGATNSAVIRKGFSIWPMLWNAPPERPAFTLNPICRSERSWKRETNPNKCESLSFFGIWLLLANSFLFPNLVNSSPFNPIQHEDCYWCKVVRADYCCMWPFFFEDHSDQLNCMEADVCVLILLKLTWLNSVIYFPLYNSNNCFFFSTATVQNFFCFYFSNLNTSHSKFLNYCFH